MEVRDYGLYIAGKSVPASSNETADVLDPATNRPFARVASGSRDDVNAAVEAARAAFDSADWRDLDPSKRGRLLWLLGQQVRDHFDELSRLESQNVGKPLREAKGDIAYVYKLFEYYAGMADKIQGDTIPVPGARFDYTLREPLGVTAHIAPWNYPLLLASRGVAPALAAGNSVVLKPATLTPLTALKLGELATAAGFPSGIVNVVTGPGREVGRALAAHPDVDSVTFTGSTDTGKQLLHVVADRVVPTTLELGGKNPQIVLPDAKIDRAVKGALWGAFQNAGQMCWAGSKLLVHESIAPSFLAKLKDQTEKLRLGPPLKDDVQMGPLVSREHAANVVQAIEDGIEQGSKLLAGGGRSDSAELKDGNFVRPTIFEDPPARARVSCDEVFGPVVAAWPFDEMDDAIAKANDTPYGLAAGGWTQDIAKGHAIARRLQAGVGSAYQVPGHLPPPPRFRGEQTGRRQRGSLCARACRIPPQQHPR